MDPVSMQVSQAAALRPAGALPFDLAAVLRQGSILAGEVLQTFAGGSLLIGVGRHRIPARSQAQLQPELQPGRSFLFRVEEEEGEVVLRLLQDEPEEQPLRRALRSALGRDRPLGEVLRELWAALAAAGEADGPPERLLLLRELAARLRGHVLSPASGGAALREGLLASGLFQEHRLAALAVLESSPSQARSAAQALAAGAGGLAPALGDPVLGPFVRLLLRRAASSGTPPGEGKPEGGRAASLWGDLKTQLLRALADLPEGLPREAVARALASLETEQLLNAARAQGGEPQQWSLLLQEGAAWTLLHLQHEPPPEAGDGGAANEAEKVHRLSLALELRHAGAVRMDLSLRAGLLSARLRVGSERVASALRATLGELEQALAQAGRRVALSVAVEQDEQLRLVPTHDVRFLRERPLLDTVA